MKPFKLILLLTLLAATSLTPLISSAEDSTKAKVKPYKLTTCVVSDEKLGGEMGPPFVYIYKDKAIKNDPGREIKFCCKSCLKDFNKDTAGYIKKLDAAEAKTKK